MFVVKFPCQHLNDLFSMVTYDTVVISSWAVLKIKGTYFCSSLSMATVMLFVGSVFFL